MSDSPQTQIMMDEEVPLNTIPGSGDTKNNNICNQVISSNGRTAASCCDDKYHRKLAICSIICGISCIGIKSLINSVKAEKTTDLEEAAKFSQRAKEFGIISIVTWVVILALIPILMAVISYLLTLQDWPSSMKPLQKITRRVALLILDFDKDRQRTVQSCLLTSKSHEDMNKLVVTQNTKRLPYSFLCL